MSDNLAPHQRSREAQFPRIRKNDNGRPLLMGILNITPDSFYSDSRFSEEDALKKAEQMIAKEQIGLMLAVNQPALVLQRFL